MKKLGVLIHQASGSQKYTSISKSLNQLYDKDKSLDSILFYSDVGKHNGQNEFALMQSVEALDYDGIIIATDIISAYFLDGCIRAKEKYFYIWDIDWHLQNKPINFIKDVYLNPNTKLIARSTDHAKLISRVFRKPEHIIEEFNYEQIIKHII